MPFQHHCEQCGGTYTSARRKPQRFCSRECGLEWLRADPNRARAQARAGRDDHGHTNSPTYGSWRAMRRRCTDPNNIGYAKYGGAGVTVCDRWASFKNFLADMGERPRGMTLDRFPNPTGNYEPGNCRWATWDEQENNKTIVRLLTVAGETLSGAQWGRRKGLSRHTVSRRLRAGATVEQAVMTPKRTKSDAGRMGAAARREKRALTP